MLTFQLSVIEFQNQFSYTIVNKTHQEVITLIKRIQYLLICLSLTLTCLLSVSVCQAKKSYVTNFTTVTRKDMGNIVIKWNQNKSVTGYQIQYSQKSSFKGAKTKTVSKKTTQMTLKKLPKKTYYIRIRGYKKIRGKRKYSSYRKCKVIAWNDNWKYADSSKIHKDAAVIFYAPSKRKGKIIAINAGHGTKNGSKYKTWCHPDHSPKVTGGSTKKGEEKAACITSGTTLLNGTSEAAATLKVAKKVKSLLLTAGYDVLMLRQDSNANLDNIARTVYANQYAACHISIHFDSTKTNKGAYDCAVPNVSSYRKMYPVSAMYKKHLALGKDLISGLKAAKVKIYGKGAKDVDLTQTSYSTVPSAVIEVGDRKTSISDANVKKMAQGIVKGVKKYF